MESVLCTAKPSSWASLEERHQGVLTIYTNQPGGNLVHKHKTVRVDEVGERTATKYIQKQLNRLKRVENLTHLISQPVFAEAFQTKWHERHLIFQPKF